VVPLLLEMRGQLPLEAEARRMADGFTAILEAIQHRTGVPLPKLAIHLDAGDEPAHWRLLAYEIPIGEGEGLDGPLMADAIARLLRRNLAMFLGVQETMTLIHSVGEQYPEVVKEAVRALPGPKLAEVMRRLADEEVPLRNMRDVLEGVADAASQEREPARVAELTRVALKRYLLDAYVVNGVLRTLTVSPELESLVKGATRIIDGVEHLALQPEVAQALVETIGNTAGDTDARVVVTSSEVRRALRRLIEPVLFDLPVLSFNELSPMVRMEVVGQIGLPSRAIVGKEAPAIAAE
jgi:type III secretion protein V